MLVEIKAYNPTYGSNEAIFAAGFIVQSQMQLDQRTQVWFTDEGALNTVRAIIADHDPIAWRAAQDLAALRERTAAAFDLVAFADAATNPVSAEDVAAHIAGIVNAHIEAKSVIETAARQATADALTASQGAAGVAAIKP